MCPLWYNWQYAIIRSDDGLALSRREAIIWTNDGILNYFTNAYMRLSALMG